MPNGRGARAEAGATEGHEPSSPYSGPMTTPRRTSTTHPLQIAEVSAGRGAIGITLCPGKKGESLFGAPWDRDLEKDLEAVQAWGATTLVTLLEDHEFDELTVAQLRTRPEALGLDWIHLPIRDVSTPATEFEAAWSWAGLLLRERLRAGARVVVHCRGGLGRAGLVAARLLVEMGESPESAIDRVRAARKGAIETSAQERHVMACRRHDSARDAAASRVFGSMFGGAVGDAFGYAVEFDSLASIARKFGPRGIETPTLKGGKLVVSDDTQMTLFTGEGMLLARDWSGDAVIASVREAYLDWYATQQRTSAGARKPYGTLCKEKVLCVPRAPGNTCMSALRAGGNGTPDRPINGSKGCGGVMRTAPFGLIPTRINPDQAFDLGVRAAALTHGHPSGFLPAGAIARMICRMCEGMTLAQAVEESRIHLAPLPGSEETAAVLSVALEKPLHSELGRFPGGWQGWVGEEALAIAVQVGLGASSFQELMRRSANHDGDSDSTASIAGQLHGAEHGIAGIPAGWIARLDCLEPVRRIADGMFRAGHEG